MTRLSEEVFELRIVLAERDVRLSLDLPEGLGPSHTTQPIGSYRILRYSAGRGNFVEPLADGVCCRLIDTSLQEQSRTAIGVSSLPTIVGVHVYKCGGALREVTPRSPLVKVCVERNVVLYYEPHMIFRHAELRK